MLKVTQAQKVLAILSIVELTHISLASFLWDIGK